MKYPNSYTELIRKRVCFNCNSNKTLIDRRSSHHWYRHNNNWYCNKCDNTLFKNPKWRPRKLGFKNKSIYLDKKVRTGICSECGKKVGDKYINSSGIEKIVTRTHIHHIEYHEDDPMKDTIELCIPCHARKKGTYTRVRHNVVLYSKFIATLFSKVEN